MNFLKRFLEIRKRKEKLFFGLMAEVEAQRQDKFEGNEFEPSQVFEFFFSFLLSSLSKKKWHIDASKFL